MASRKDVRAKVNDALRQRGHEPNGISNVKAARILGLIPQDLRGPCVSSSRLLKEWAFPSDPPKIDAWVKKLVRQHEMDGSVNASLIVKKIVKHKQPSKPIIRQGVADDSFLTSYEWRRLRMSALKLHGARCQCCGATARTGAVMNVDHIKPRKLFPDLALSLDNLQVLCHECNHGKGNWDVTDWRPEKESGITEEEKERARQLEIVRRG